MRSVADRETVCSLMVKIHYTSKNISVSTFISWRYSLEPLTAFPWSTQ